MAAFQIEGPQYDNREGWNVFDDDRRDYDQSAVVFNGTEAEAQRVLDLLAHGAFGDLSDYTTNERREEIEYQMAKVPCERCVIDTPRIEMGDGLVCNECRS